LFSFFLWVNLSCLEHFVVHVFVGGGVYFFSRGHVAGSGQSVLAHGCVLLRELVVKT
jgi:hypothetical protein